MMRDAILSLPEQLKWKPIIANREKFFTGASLVVCGMGGSRVWAEIFEMLRPGTVARVHSDYSLPAGAEKMSDVNFVISSYSGNTEETLSAYATARAVGLPLAVITVGGKLLELAKQDGAAYIQLPNTGIQPRASTGFGVKAFAALIGDEKIFKELETIAEKLQPTNFEISGKTLAELLDGKLPLIYSSARNAALAQNWKIKINENAKAPAFWNVLPEMNHNEMTGFASAGGAVGVISMCHVIFLRDNEDFTRVRQRMDVTEKLLIARGVTISRVDLVGVTRMEKVFNALLLGDWTSVALGERYGVDTEQVPMVEEFKKMI